MIFSRFIASLIVIGAIAVTLPQARAQTTQPVPDRAMDQSSDEQPSVYNADRPIPNSQPVSHPSALPPIGHNDGTNLKNPPPPPDGDNVLANPPVTPDEK